MIKPMLLIFLAITSTKLLAASENYTTGPVFSDYGKNIEVADGLIDAKNQHFKVVFDIDQAAKPGKLNRNFDSLARFINMHVRAGVPLENIELAMVIHGKAGLDLLNAESFQQRFEQIKVNASADLVKQLIANKVQVFICGQSAAYLNIKKSDLMDGVSMSLSAMTANALLQQQGYSLNPF